MNDALRISAGEAHSFDIAWMRRFPRRGPHKLSGGTTCFSPFVVPRGSGLMLFGTANGERLGKLLADEQFSAVRCEDGRGLMCLWLSEFHDSTVGAYKEYTMTILVSDRPRVVPWVNAFTPLATQLEDGVLICEYVLLLDNRSAIDYGRELHGFDKHPGALGFRRREGRFHFDVRDEAGPVLSGDVRLPSIGSTLGALPGVMRAFGVWRTLGALLQRDRVLRVVTPNTLKTGYCDLHFRALPLLAALDPASTIRVHDGSRQGALLAGLGFCATAVQWLPHLQGVMPL